MTSNFQIHHEQRLWQNMVDLIQNYLNGETKDFYGLIGQLEGALDASDIQDHALIILIDGMIFGHHLRYVALFKVTKLTKNKL